MMCATASKSEWDQIIISNIIVVQFLFSLLWLLITLFAFISGSAVPHAYWYWFLFFIAFWIVGLASSILLRKRRPWHRIVAALWHSLLVGYTFIEWGHWESIFKLFCFFAIYGIFAISYLAVTALPHLALLGGGVGSRRSDLDADQR
jgi:hypothetical protein